ncbi:uncharacterized protein MELLADRAFT_111300 [Melampsora larici-populina 98AG31]|uniref:Uncharacterized protein n=1 Tax=Melampsora larici-populina (strain 98AG31 / pathotype 3-4-7) TaxID=747676 RepID=F4S2P3_MELLP|nr:uncharacterized protein MELLADRAFT_111300 [Melampsora larici-populina 98AG31]EGG01093.1 hypothetical protein MELLADRAFT_111300 [Melampsora larici-populina 98AG31]
MAEHTPQYVYPVKSVVLPKRHHGFLAYNIAHPLSEASTREYHHIIEVFHPKLALPLNLAKDIIIRIFQVLMRIIYLYISTNAHPEHEKPYPTGSLVIPQDLIKFICIHDDPDLIVEASSEEYLRIISLFFPDIQLPQSFDRETLISLFEIIVLPFFRPLEELDEHSGYIRYLQVEVIRQIQPKVIPTQVVTLPVNLHRFLAFANPKGLRWP